MEELQHVGEGGNPQILRFFSAGWPLAETIGLPGLLVLWNLGR